MYMKSEFIAETGRPHVFGKTDKKKLKVMLEQGHYAQQSLIKRIKIYD